MAKRNGAKKGFFAKVKDNRQLLLMILPAVVFFVVFCYVPMGGIVLAFEKYNFKDRFLSPLVGLQNFNFLFLNNAIYNVIRNTVLYNFAFILVNNAIQILFAILMSQLAGKWFKKIAQTASFLPFFISWVVIGALGYNLLNSSNGLINSILPTLGLHTIDFYNSPKLWPVILVLVSAWKSAGYGTAVYLAAIMSIDTEMYEAASIDGASILQKIRHLTIPCLVPTIIILVLLSLGGIFRGNFEMFYQMVGNNSILLPTTDVVDTFVTRALLQSSNVGMSAAAGLAQSVAGFLIILGVNQAVRLYEKDYSLF
jgi:putative aldouronate transport system permease protein